MSTTEREPIAPQSEPVVSQTPNTSDQKTGPLGWIRNNKIPSAIIGGLGVTAMWLGLGQLKGEEEAEGTRITTTVEHENSDGTVIVESTEQFIPAQEDTVGIDDRQPVSPETNESTDYYQQLARLQPAGEYLTSNELYAGHLDEVITLKLEEYIANEGNEDINDWNIQGWRGSVIQRVPANERGIEEDLWIRLDNPLLIPVSIGELAEVSNNQDIPEENYDYSEYYWAAPDNNGNFIAVLGGNDGGLYEGFPGNPDKRPIVGDTDSGQHIYLNPTGLRTSEGGYRSVKSFGDEEVIYSSASIFNSEAEALEDLGQPLLYEEDADRVFRDLCDEGIYTDSCES